MVNLDNNREKTDAFATEFCQTVFLESSMRLFDNTMQEKACNTFGIAMFAAQNNLSYAEYQKIAVKEGNLPNNRTISLTPYTEFSYKKLVEIFVKPKIPSTPVPIDKKSSITKFTALSEYLKSHGLILATLDKKDMNIIRKTAEYLSSIYDRFIHGDLQLASQLARAAITDKAFLSNLPTDNIKTHSDDPLMQENAKILLSESKPKTPAIHKPPKNTRPGRKIFSHKPVSW